MWIQAVLYSFGSSCKTESVGKGFPINFFSFPVKSRMETLPLAALQSTWLAVHAEQQTVGFMDLQAGHPLGRGRTALAGDLHPKAAPAPLSLPLCCGGSSSCLKT